MMISEIWKDQKNYHYGIMQQGIFILKTSNNLFRASIS